MNQITALRNIQYLNTLYVSVQVGIEASSGSVKLFKYIICISSRFGESVTKNIHTNLNTLYVSVQENKKKRVNYSIRFKYIICISSSRYLTLI